MNPIDVLGLLILIFSVACIVLAFYADSDVITFLYSHYGKQPETELKGKVVWITGASSGIGESITKHLVKCGAKVVLSSRRKDELERVKQQCLTGSKTDENNILVLPLDVTNFQSHEPALKIVLKKFGKLDIFLSNAGQLNNPDVFVELDIAQDRHIFEVNVFSVVNMNRLVVRYFLGNGGGHIAVISSLTGKFPCPNVSLYSASKHAVQGYFGSLRAETYGKKIDVTMICPGPVATPIFKKGVTKNPGELSTINVDVTSMMTSERCAHLALVSIANRLNESWIGKVPFVSFLTYFIAYLPVLLDSVSKIVASRVSK